MASPPRRKRKAKAPSGDVDALLRARGLRRTHARAAVLRHVLAVRKPVTHGDVAQALEDEGFDRATVYRNLVDLAEAGLLSRTDLGDHVWRFELRRGHADGGAHAHFICTGCGAVSCLPSDAVRLVSTKKTPKSLARKAVVVQVKGVCDDCA